MTTDDFELCPVCKHILTWQSWAEWWACFSCIEVWGTWEIDLYKTDPEAFQRWIDE